MDKSQLEAYIRSAFPDAKIVITDLAGDGDHYQADIYSDAFVGKSRVEQHKMVYATLGDKMGGVLHALSIRTFSKET
jgi:stress-induced morphogen